MVRELERSEVASVPITDPVIKRELQTFQREAAAFLSGELSPEDYRAFRLQHGVYGQRQSNVHMIRVKIPHGSLTADQFEAIGDIIDRYSPRKIGHVTTRQDIQMHFVPMDAAAKVLEELAEVGLTTREACGNTVRNVTADHYSGLCEDTVFDVTPYAEATARYFLRNPVNQKLPRKFKITFSSCPHDWGMIPIHDLGAMAVIRNGKKGFAVYVGGGLGAAPRLAELYDDFVPAEELLRHIEAILRVFDRHGERRNRNKARIKFLVARLGIEEVRRLVREELKSLPPIDSGVYREPDPAFLEEAASHPAWAASHPSIEPRPGFDLWKRTNAVRQRQEGFRMCYILLPIGDLTIPQFRAVAEMARRYAGGKLRTTQNQNLVLRWVHEADLPYLHADLVDAGLAEDRVLSIYDVQTCPGADTCNLGVTSSKGLGRAIREALFAANGVFEDPLVQKIKINVSGCPNSCGQHHIADLGFYGMAVNKDGRHAPAFQLLVGGRGSGDGRLAKMTMKVGARRVPEAVVKLVSHYIERRNEGEEFGDWALRVGGPYIQELLAEYKEVPAFTEDPTAYVDWGGTSLFSLEGLGEGECAV